MDLLAFLHEHPLKLQRVEEAAGARCCSICKDKLQGEAYVCEDVECGQGFQAHRSCTRLQRKIQHYLHPCPLVLCVEENYYSCDACFQSWDQWVSYQCKDCDFGLDVPCSRVPAPQELGNRFLHFSHGHPLTNAQLPQLGIAKEEEEEDASLCKICGEPCSGDHVVGCNGCKFFLHRPCLGMLPQRIRRLSLHPHDLILYAPLSKAESYNPNQVLMFCCGRCHFYLCMQCWLTSGPGEVSESRQPDTNLELGLGGRVCSVCRRKCTAPSWSNNDGTDRILSQPNPSFQGLPEQIQHISHPLQPLPLVNLTNMGIHPMRCNLCLGYCSDRAFLCFQDACPLSLHPECASLTPTVMSSDHGHPLTVVEKIYDDGVQCSRCRASCSNFSVLRCQLPKCNYTIHIWCGPLPCCIDHSIHVHPLALKDYLANDDDDEDDENNFCCHFCEGPRDPRLGVYCCEQGCNMICEVQCVASEVIATLRGKHGDKVTLRIVGKAYQRTCNILTNINLSKEMIIWDVRVEEDEVLPNMSFLQILWKVGYYSQFRYIVSRFLSHHPESSKDVSDFVLSEEAFAQLISRLESHDITHATAPDRLVRDLKEIGMHSSYLEREDVRSIIEYCPDAIQRIVSANIRQEAKNSAIAFARVVLESLITTKVVDVNEEKLQEWWGYLNWIKKAGVDIEFMFDRLKQVARAYFSLQARSLVAEKERELEKISKEIDRLRIKAEALRNQRDIYSMSMRNPSAFVKQCLKEGRRLRWKPAIEVLDQRREPKLQQL